MQDWGVVSENDLRMQTYQPDSAASTVVLQDIGDIDVSIFGVVVFNRHRRIKIFDVQAFEQSNLMIPYRERKRARDELRDIDVQVISSDGVIRKVKSDNVYTERIARGWLAKKVFIPNIRKGDIVEYRYKMKSDDILSLYDWYFQEEIPVRWSEMKVYLPAELQYTFLENKSRPFDVYETEEDIKKGTHYYYTKRWAMANIPALKDEPYIASLDEYRTSLKFQLRSFIGIGSTFFPLSLDWNLLAFELERFPFFGDQYKVDENFNRLWESFKTEIKPEDSLEQKATKALRFINKNIKWNGNFYLVPDGTLNEAFEQKSGNSAALNLALVALLRKAGVDAAPMLLSTRENGPMYKKHPFVAQFNSVIAIVRNDDQAMVLDATDPHLPANLLQMAHYHGAAWLVDGRDSKWLDLGAPEAAEIWYGKMYLKETGEMTGNFHIQTTGNIAADWRAKLDSTKTTEFLRKTFCVKYPDIQLDSVTFLRVDELEQPLSVKFKCTAPGASTVANDFIYCQPVLDFFMLENPFRSLDRRFPVEFTTPFKAQYVLDLVLPEGYVVDEFPEPSRVNLPDNAGKMSFTCTENGRGAIQVHLRMNITKTKFTPQEYGALRQFFEIAVEKTQYQLVLKKK